MANKEQNTTLDKANQKTKPGNPDLIDTDNDGKYRAKGDTSDHGDPRSPYGKKTTGSEKNRDTDDVEERDEEEEE